MRRCRFQLDRALLPVAIASVGFEETFQFGKCGEIFRTACGALGADQAGQIENGNPAVKCVHDEWTAALTSSHVADTGNFRKKIDFTQIRHAA